MRIAVVGHTSLIGRAVGQRCAGEHDILWMGRGPGADLRLDLADDSDIDADGRACDALVHAAASFEPDTPAGWLANERVNSLGALKVAWLARSLKCRHIVFLGSIFSSRDPTNGYHGSYGLSKQHGEDNLAQVCRQEGMIFTSLVLPQIFDRTGAFGRHQPLLLNFLKKALVGAPVVLYGKRDVERCFLDAEDVAEIVLRVLARGLAGRWECPGFTHRLSEWARLAFAAAGREGVISFDPTKGDIRSTWIPTDRSLYQTLAFEPRITPLVGLRRCLEHLA